MSEFRIWFIEKYLEWSQIWLWALTKKKCNSRKMNKKKKQVLSRLNIIRQCSIIELKLFSYSKTRWAKQIKCRSDSGVINTFEMFNITLIHFRFSSNHSEIETNALAHDIIKKKKKMTTTQPMSKYCAIKYCLHHVWLYSFDSFPSESNEQF